MNVNLENLGILKEAELEVNEFTVICGENNTGKTYAAYALFGFLLFWRRYLPILNLSNHIESLLRDGVTRIDVSKYLRDANKILAKGCDDYASNLSEIFASKSNQFANAKFQIQFEQSAYSIKRQFHRSFQASDSKKIFSVDKANNSSEIIVSLLLEKDVTDYLPKTLINEFISNCIHELVFKPLLPSPFIASVERTGATIFRKELNFARNRLLEEMMKAGEDIDPFDLLLKSYKDYPLPVKVDVDFTRNLQSVSKNDSSIRNLYPEVLADFATILGGKFSVDKEDTIYFSPKGNSIKLEMDESSSSVRSLLDLGFYLHHQAKPGDMLLIDEPELNLHPRNQCLMARLLVRLMNFGIKIFITTHSDYLVKELNTLIMLNSDEPHLKEIAEREKYRKDELLDAQRISVYIAEKSLIKLKGNQRKSRWPTLVRAEIDSQFGIEVPSFDDVINQMNSIQEEIVWAESDG